MPDVPQPPLDELRRQRELVANHLAWLDRQIAQREPSAPRMVPLPDVTGVHGGLAGLPTFVPVTDPEAILEQYRLPTTSVTQRVRRGCLVYFAVGFLLLGAVVWLLYLTLRS